MIKNIIIIGASIVILFLDLYFGSLLPFKKAISYVGATNRLQSVKTIEDFKNNFNESLNFYSPVGQEEVVRLLGSDIVGKMIYQGQPESASRELVDYIEPRIFLNNSRQLLLMAIAYWKMFDIYGDKSDLVKSENYFQKLLVLNPKSPQALFSLFEIYQKTGQSDKVREIGEIIYRYWPEAITANN